MEAKPADGPPSIRVLVRRMGNRRLASSMVVGALSLMASVGGGALGAWIALERSDLEFGPPESLFANAFVLAGALVVAAFGGLIGFFAAVTTLPSLVIWLLGWPRPLYTALTIVAIEIVDTFGRARRSLAGRQFDCRRNHPGRDLSARWCGSIGRQIGCDPLARRNRWAAHQRP
jgi:hypothetical protein